MKSKQFFFILIGVIAALTVASGVGYYYALTELHKRSAALADKLASEDAQNQEVQTLTSLQHKYNKDIVPILPLIDSALPRDKKQTEMLAQIERIAEGVGLPQLSSVTMPTPAGAPSGISQTVKAGTIIALPINFQVIGSYAQLQTFLARLENLNRFTDVTTLVVNHDDPSKPAMYIINLNAYIKP